MADIFTILLVFLLKSYSTSLSSVTPATSILLPTGGKSETAIKDTVKLEISNDSVLIDEKPVVRLVGFQFRPEDVNANGQNQAIFDVLFEERKHQPIPNMDSNLIIMADQEVPFSTLKTIIGSAGAAGFVDLQLVTMEDE